MRSAIAQGWTALAALALTTACSGGGGGGEPAPPIAPSVSGLASAGTLARIARADAAVTMRTGIGGTGWHFANAIAIDPATDAVYTLASSHSGGVTVLLRIDPTAGPRGLASAPTPVAEVEVGPRSLAWHCAERMLYGVTLIGSQPWQPANLVRIDPTTGESEVVGSCSRVTSLAYDPVTEMLYGVESTRFVRIDPASGQSLDLFTETSILPNTHGLALDPLTGTFRTATHDPFTAPRLATIDLFGNVDDEGSVSEPIADLAIDPSSGATLALTTGLGIAEVQGGAPTFSLQHRGNLGCDLFDMSYDPADGGYFGLTSTNHIVKLWPGDSSRTIGWVEDELFSIVYDVDRRELWGMRETERDFVPIDRATAATGAPTSLTISAASKLAYDSTNRAFRAYSHLNGVTLEFDPTLGTSSLTSNGQGLGPMIGMTWDPAGQRLVGAYDPNPGSNSAVRRVDSWNPFVSGGASSEALTVANLRTFERRGASGTYHAVSSRGDLVEMTLGTSGTESTVGAPTRGRYFATVYVQERGRIFALGQDEVVSIDPVTGASERVGSTPSTGSLPRGITWDSERERLGFLDGDEILWTSINSPWNVASRTQLNGIQVERITYAPSRGVYYAMGNSGLFSIAMNPTSAAVIQVTSTPAPANLRGMTWRDGAIWAATDEQRLVRIDPDTGEWTDIGRTRFGMSGLY